MAKPAKTSAAAKVASAGTISSSPDRTMMIESAATASANHPSRDDQIATFDIGSSWNGRRAMLMTLRRSS